jgi:hypothetical protein
MASIQACYSRVSYPRRSWLVGGNQRCETHIHSLISLLNLHGHFLITRGGHRRFEPRYFWMERDAQKPPWSLDMLLLHQHSCRKPMSLVSYGIS